MSKFYKITIIILIVGLLLTGVGGAVSLAEIRGFDVMGERYADTEMKTTTSAEVLPDNLAKIFYENPDIEFSEDNTIPYNNVIIETTFSSAYDVEPIFDINEEAYLHNWNTDKYSEYAVNKLSLGWSIKDNSYEFEVFKDILHDIKDKKIYSSYNRFSDISFIIKGSAETLERFSEMPDMYDIVYSKPENTAEYDEEQSETVYDSEQIEEYPNYIDISQDSYE